MHRSTTLNLLLRTCPAALDMYDAHVPYDREVYQYGVASHAVLEAIVKQPDHDPAELAESVVRELVTNGRSFYGHAEPPMDVHAATDGRDVALGWLARDFDGIDPRWQAETMLSVDRNWNPCEHRNAWLHAIIDVTGPCTYEDEEMAVEGVLHRDWKGSWVTSADDLHTLQLKIQTCLVAANNPDAAFIRRQVTNLRTGQTFSEDLWMDDEGRETLAQWRRDIAHVCAQAEAVGPDGRRVARPGPRCGGCPYVLTCSDATQGLPMGWTCDRDEYTDIVQLARYYAIIDAMRTEMAKTLRHATKEAPIIVDGGEVGYQARVTRVATDDAPEALALAWFKPDNWSQWQRENEETLGLLAAAKLGAGQIKAIGMVLFPGRGDSAIAEFKEMRADLEDATLQEKIGAVFGVTKSK